MENVWLLSYRGSTKTRNSLFEMSYIAKCYRERKTCQKYHKKFKHTVLPFTEVLPRTIRRLTPSLRSKRGVREQRKSEKRDFQCFVCAKNGSRAKKRKEGEGEGKEGNACRQTPGF